MRGTVLPKAVIKVFKWTLLNVTNKFKPTAKNGTKVSKTSCRKRDTKSKARVNRNKLIAIKEIRSTERAKRVKVQVGEATRFNFKSHRWKARLKTYCPILKCYLT